MGDNSRSEGTEDWVDDAGVDLDETLRRLEQLEPAEVCCEADVMFGREVARLVRTHRGLTERNPDRQQANADVQAFVAKEYPLEVLAALLAQAVSRIVDLEDLVRV